MAPNFKFSIIADVFVAVSFVVTLIAVMFSLIFAPALYADPGNNPGKGRGHASQEQGKGNSGKAGKNLNKKQKKVKFSAEDKNLITKYFKAKSIYVDPAFLLLW